MKKFVWDVVLDSSGKNRLLDLVNEFNFEVGGQYRIELHALPSMCCLEELYEGSRWVVINYIRFCSADSDVVRLLDEKGYVEKCREGFHYKNENMYLYSDYCGLLDYLVEEVVSTENGYSLIGEGVVYHEFFKVSLEKVS